MKLLMNIIIAKKHRLRSITLIILIIVFSCGEKKSKNENGNITDSPSMGGTFHYSLDIKITLDPHSVADTYSASVSNQIFEGLIEFDINTQPIPALAESWIISADRLKYTLFLRKGVEFHDGKVFNSRDVVYSLERVISSNTIGGMAAFDFLKKIKGAVELKEGKADKLSGVEIIDSLTVIITLTEPYPLFLMVLAMGPLKIISAGTEIKSEGNNRWKNVNGTGPFKYGGYDENENLTLLANEEYYKGRPYLDSLIYMADFNQDDDYPFEAFLKGERDMIGMPSGTDAISKIEGKYPMIVRPELSMEFIGINSQIAPLNFQEVRRALYIGLTGGKHGAVWGKWDIAAEGIVPIGMTGYIPRRREDPEETVEDIAAKFRKSHEGESWDVHFWSTDTINTAKLTVILAQFNTKLNIHKVSWEELTKRLIERRADLWDLVWVADMPDASSFIRSLFYSKSASNEFNYSNPTVDRLIEESERELDPEVRGQLIRQIEDIILIDLPMIPIANYVNVYALQPYVRGLQLSTLDISSVKFKNVWLTK